MPLDPVLLVETRGWLAKAHSDLRAAEAPYLHLQESYRDRLLGAPKSGEFGDKSAA